MSEQADSILPEALSVNDACKFAGFERSTIYKYFASGDLPARKLGRKTLVLRSDLVRFLENLPAATFAKAA